jgi:hypothetical protein
MKVEEELMSFYRLLNWNKVQRRNGESQMKRREKEEREGWRKGRRSTKRND